MGHPVQDRVAESQDAMASQGDSRSYSIADLAGHFGLTMRALRFYEEKDLLRPVRKRNRRIYTQSDFNILTDIVRMKAVGMTIAEIRSIIDLIRSGQTAEAEAQSVQIAQRRRQEIDKQIKELCEAAEEADRLAGAIKARVGWFKSA